MNEVFELRILKVPRSNTVSGYFDNLARLKGVAHEWSGKAPGVFRTLNPVNPALLSRAANRVIENATQTTSDADIVQRHWLPIDFDPVRPAGISSTNQEHEAAIARARDAAIWLSTLGFPGGLHADSGNGAHLLYRIDLPNTPESTTLVKKCLEALALRFTDNAVAVDLTCYNAARIWKVYDTLAAKGDNTPERPHRVAKILDQPTKLEVVSDKLLGCLAAMVPVEPKREPTRQSVSQFNIDDWIVNHGLDVTTSGPWAQGGRKWILAQCPWNQDHTNRSAYIVELASGALGAGCHHNGCAGNGWPELRQLLEPERRADPFPQSAQTAPLIDSATKENKVAETNFELQKWADFVATDHGSAAYTVSGLAPDSGEVAFHGRGKGGKTTFLIHASRAIAAGTPFLDRATTQKPVVYLNYEMGFAYLKELLSAGGPCPDEAYILNRPEPVLQIATIEALMQQIGKPGVMVIDSFRGAFRLAGDAENSAGGAGVILRNVQDIAVKNKWLVILVHHSNRGNREGTDGVSGTSDWIAAPDVIWTWQRPDKAKPGVFSIEGRLPPVDPLAVDLSPERCVFVGSVEQSQEETDNKAILEALTEEGQTADVLAEMLDRPAGTVRRRLEALSAKEQLKRDGAGKRGDPHLYSKVCFHHENILVAETNFPVGNGSSNGWAKAR